MAPFQYQPWRNPYVNSISALMEQQGAIPAAATRQVADAQAQARLASGNAWAGAAQQTGQAVSGAIQQATDPRRKLEALQAESAQGQIADQNQLRSGQRQVDQMMTSTPLSAGQQGPQQESYLTPDGLFDIPKMNAHLAQGGSAHLAPELLSGAERINEAIKKSQEHDIIASNQKTLLYGDIADGVEKLVKIGMPLMAAMDFAVKPALATKRLQTEEYEQLKQQLGQLPPERQLQALQTFKDAAEKLDKGDTLAEGAIHVGRYGRTEAANPKIDRPTESSLAADAATLGTPNETLTAKQSAAAMALLKPKAHGEVREGFVIKGTSNIPTYHPDTDTWSFAGQPVASEQVVRSAPQKDPIAQALAQLQLQQGREKLDDTQRRKANVKAIADGMKNGTIPPDPEGLSRQGIYADVIGQMAQDKVNFEDLRKNWLAAKRLIVTENSPQSNRLDTAVRSGLKMYDAIDSLSSQWDGMGLGPLSRANLKLAMEGAKGRDAANLAIQLNGQIAQLTSDVATVEQNGMTPTQESRHVAEQSMQSWWGNDTIHAMTAQGRANMRIREAARNESTPLVPGAAQPTSGLVPTMRYNPLSGKVEPVKP